LISLLILMLRRAVWPISTGFYTCLNGAARARKCLR
jgi:hypothetical protein